ncbi:MAG: hypothetical protein OD811_01620, partial [Alphaproteobacteria bacterium]
PYLPRRARVLLHDLGRGTKSVAGVVLPSARTARLFAELVGASGHTPYCTRIIGIARSDAIAEVARDLLPWRIEVMPL